MRTNFLDHLRKRETSLIAQLHAQKAGIEDATGKGSATEEIISTQLIEPNLPPPFRCLKGAVVSLEDPAVQSPAIDRIIYDPGAASPLIYSPSHSVFPIESVAGTVEIAMHLDGRKLRKDIQRMASIRSMKARYFASPVAGMQARSWLRKVDALSPRSFVIGMPASPAWTAEQIATTFRKIQSDLGPPTHVHGLYVLGVGCFQTLAVENTNDEMYRIQIWGGPQGLFRFTTLIRTALDRWPRIPPGSSAYMDGYLTGTADLLSDAGYIKGL